MAKQTKKSNPKTHTAVDSRSGAKYEASQKSVDDAKAGTGQYTPATKYKGKEHKDSGGNIYGVTTNAGKFIRTPGPVQRAKASKTMASDKAKFDEQSRVRTNRNTAMKKAEKKPNVSSKK